MLKNVMIWVSLSCYFLVALATNVMNGQAAKHTILLSSKAHYVHAVDCQARYYLQFDCFDQCNNDSLSETHAEIPQNQAFLLRLIGFDFHYHTVAVFTSANTIATELNFPSSAAPTLHNGFEVQFFPLRNLFKHH